MHLYRYYKGEITRTCIQCYFICLYDEIYNPYKGAVEPYGGTTLFAQYGGRKMMHIGKRAIACILSIVIVCSMSSIDMMIALAEVVDTEHTESTDDILQD